ncbi:tigger transposable element-derived protein 4 [Ixodes scapularis]|uniref:tigger transposable element-derived protein 4 n=1 Tax=Ixodes scapularis TaxID=6945 RepID=UPI001AD7744A|nr:tigger transposable element-derived protein 4 [Ixodes scapularis]
MSDGWLSRFKKRHGLVFKTISGEGAAVNRNLCSNWQQGRLQEILQTFEARDVYNADELGLFYKALPTKTLTFKGETCTGGKRSKERITVLVGANMDGSDKLRLVVVGKAQNPRCFKGVVLQSRRKQQRKAERGKLRGQKKQQDNVSSGRHSSVCSKGIRELPVTYYANRKAWMTQTIFETWLREQDARFTREGRKVVFIVDNCPAHGEVDGLKSIILEFMPPNATAVIQPMDQGVIQNLKVYYRRQLLHRMLLCADSGKDYSVNLLSALHMLTYAWEQVKVSTVQRCFHHAGFARQEVIPEEEGDTADADAADADILFGQLVSSTSFTRQDYETLDANVTTCREESIEELVAEVQGEEASSSSEDDVECNDPGPAAVPDCTAREAVALLQRYFESEGCAEFLRNLQGMHTYFVKKRLQNAKQTTITSFF